MNDAPDLPWEACRAFLAVARAGSLAAAAEATGLSPPTLGRRVLELEEAVGRPLVARSRSGYALTPEGEALLDRLRPMEGAARAAALWARAAGQGGTVRLIAGTWVAWLLSENMLAIRAPHDAFALELTVTERRPNLGHREGDVALRAQAPTEEGLLARGAGEVAYAPFRRRHAGALPWAAVAEAEAVSAYLRWPHALGPALTVTRPRSLLDLARSGAAQAVLPCVVGDLDPLLERAGEEIRELRHPQFIVTLAQDRHRREVRTVSDRLFRLLRAHGELFAGRRPSRG